MRRMTPCLALLLSACFSQGRSAAKDMEISQVADAGLDMAAPSSTPDMGVPILDMAAGDLAQGDMWLENWPGLCPDLGWSNVGEKRTIEAWRDYEMSDPDIFAGIEYLCGKGTVVTKSIYDKNWCEFFNYSCCRFPEGCWGVGPLRFP